MSVVAPLSRLFPSKRHLVLASILLLAAILIRCRAYLLCAPLWGDEASIALNILDRDFQGLLHPLDFRQMAPYLYLVLVKVSEMFFGGGELALRLPALLVSMAVLPICLMLYLRILPGRYALVALLFVAGSSPLINYSAEVKQYAFDVFWCTLLFYLVHRWQKTPEQPRHWIVLALMGSLAIWSSHASFILLGGVGVTLAGFALYDRNYRQLAALAALGLVWVGMFAWFFSLLQPSAEVDNHMHRYWASEMLPAHVSFRTLASWAKHVVSEHCTYVAPSYLAWIAGPLIVLGAIRLYTNDRRSAILVFSVFLSVLTTAILRKYPLGQRLCLYLLPFYFLLLSSGICSLCGTRKLSFSLKNAVLACALIPLLLAPAWGFYKFASGRSIRPPNTRSILQGLQTEAEEQDVVYVYAKAVNIYKYYLTRPEFSQLAKTHWQPGTTIGKEKTGYEAELQCHEGSPRLWLLFIKADLDTPVALSALPAHAAIKNKHQGGDTELFEVALLVPEVNEAQQP